MCENIQNEMCIIFDSCSQNEGFARVVIAAFVSVLDPTLEEMADIKTAVSEAVTNCVIHAYENGPGKIKMNCRIEKQAVTIEISDEGTGIEDIEKSDGTAVYDKTGTGAFGYGLCIYGGIYGFTQCGIHAGGAVPEWLWKR